MTRPPAPCVTLATTSVYPRSTAAGFAAAAELGYDGVEVMVLADPVTQDAAALRRLSREYGVPILSVHAPTLLVTQRVWGTSDPWEKVDRSIGLALDVGCDAIVAHPPFRWQRDYARGFADGVALREHDRGVRLIVENMFPWRARGNAALQVYLPGWDPVPQPYDHVTLDMSHAATAGSDLLAMQDALGSRLSHVHLNDGSGSFLDEHLVPGRGGQPCGEFLRRLAGSGFDQVVAVEVSTRRTTPAQRGVDLAESLAFAREHLQPVPTPGG